MAGGAAMVAPIAMGLMSGLMGGGGSGGGKGKGGGESKPPMVVPGFESWPQTLTNALQSSQAARYFSVKPEPYLTSGATAAGLENDMLTGLQALFPTQGTGEPSIMGSFQQGLGNMNTAATSGFMPDIMSGIESRLLPAMERSFDRGAAEINEQAALGGNFSSTTRNQQMGDFRGGLESGLLSNLANIEGSLAPVAMQTRMQGTQMQMGLPGMLQGVTNPAIERALTESRFGRSNANETLGALGSVLSGFPMFQPTQGPGKMEQMMGGLGPIAGAALQGYLGNSRGYMGAKPGKG
jgi:hypothetical protein